MTISRVEIQGQLTRAQDFTTIKQNQDNKGLVDQTNFQKQFNQTVENKVRQVHQGDKAENEGKRFDAKEKGNGTYYGDGGKRRKKEEKEKDGKVVLKGHGSFDMKI
ncbi:MAG: hypothetical protein J6C64_06415 [Lachnospiraceae bacterium]|nr:hypothetical protein [Lachnospiraceae bacterium]